MRKIKQNSGPEFEREMEELLHMAEEVDSGVSPPRSLEANKAEMLALMKDLILILDQEQLAALSTTLVPHIRQFSEQMGKKKTSEQMGKAEYLSSLSREGAIKAILDGSYYSKGDRHDPSWVEQVRVHHIIDEARGLATDALLDAVEVLQSKRLMWLRIGHPQPVLDEAITLLEEKDKSVREGYESDRPAKNP